MTPPDLTGLPFGQFGMPGPMELLVMLGILATLLICPIIGAILGKRFRNQPIWGAILGFFAPVGLIAIILLPDKRLSEGQEKCPLSKNQLAEARDSTES